MNETSKHVTLKVGSWRGFLAAGAVVALSSFLAGCFVIEGPTPDAPVREKPVISVADPSFVAGGSASQNLDFFTFKVQEFAESENELKGALLVGALESAGFDRENMQVTFDASKTNVPIDSLTVSVRIADECLLGQIERKDREIFVYQTETVGPNKDLCIIGNTAQI